MEPQAPWQSPNRTAPNLNHNTEYYGVNETVSGKALAAGFTRHSPAASASPLTKVALVN